MLFDAYPQVCRITLSNTRLQPHLVPQAATALVCKLCSSCRYTTKIISQQLSAKAQSPLYKSTSSNPLCKSPSSECPISLLYSPYSASLYSNPQKNYLSRLAPESFNLETVAQKAAFFFQQRNMRCRSLLEKVVCC